MLEIKIDTNTADPIYQQIAEQIKLLIYSGEIKTGEQIPSVRDLATWLQLNPSTIARAYYLLKQEGLVVTSCRRGTIIQDITNTFSSRTQPYRVSENFPHQNIEMAFTLQPVLWHIHKSA
jgi:GntR family transcriptional regulator